jgi:hypothetical protein
MSSAQRHILWRLQRAIGVSDNSLVPLADIASLHSGSHLSTHQQVIPYHTIPFSTLFHSSTNVCVIFDLFIFVMFRTRSRRKTVVMSNHAIIRRIKGKLYFMFQCCELRKLQLISATVCCSLSNHCKITVNTSGDVLLLCIRCYNV